MAPLATGIAPCARMCYRVGQRMYLWTFHASAAWLAAHEHALEEASPGNVAVIDRPGRARSIVQLTCATKAEASDLVRRFGGAAERLARDWQKQYQQAKVRAPLRIGRRLVVVPQARPSQQRQLVIPAAGAFGTDDHPTTAMCLRLLEATTRKLPRCWCLLDAGTGTGILALAARRFGAKEVLGLDNDPRAIAHARANARLNKISGAKFLAIDLLRWKLPQPFEVIAANLFSELLIAAAPSFHGALRARGVLIVSGILREQFPTVVRAFRRSGFQIEIERRRGKWVALLCRRRPLGGAEVAVVRQNRPRTRASPSEASRQPAPHAKTLLKAR